MELVTYSGEGRGVALHRTLTLNALKKEKAFLIHPTELVEFKLPYVEFEGALTLIALGGLDDALRVLDSSKFFFNRIIVFRTKSDNSIIERKFKLFDSSIIPDNVLEASIHMIKSTLRDALNEASENDIRRSLISESLQEDEEDAIKWADENIDIPDNVVYVISAPSMEPAAVALTKLLGLRKIEKHDIKDPKEVLVLSSTAEEHWYRSLIVKGAKAVVLNLDPLVAPLYVLYKLKAMAL